MYHCDTFDNSLHWRRLEKRSFRDRGFGCNVLMVRAFNCGLRIADCGLRIGEPYGHRRFLHFFRQIAYRGLGAARGL